MVNLNTGESPTTYLLRIRKYKRDFVQPSPEEMKKDSFVIKKQKVIADVFYYMAIPVNDTVKKGGKPKQHIEYALIPKEMIIKDYEGNLDFLLEQMKKQSVPVVKDSTSLKKKK